MQTDVVILAQAPKADRDVLRLSAGESTRLELRAGDDGKRPTVSMVAYTGGAMRVWQFAHPIVVDLAGMKLPDKSRPLLHAHRDDQPVGHTTRVWVEGGRELRIEGLLSATNQITEDIIAAARNGFPWQASIGAPIRRVEFVREGSVTVNGRTFRAPVYVARESVLKETSIVALGADDDTSTSIAARRQGGGMEFDAWLRAKGFDPDQITDDQRGALKLAWEAEKRTKDKSNEQPAEPGEEAVSIVRARAAAESRRVDQICEIAADYPSIRAQAIEEGWDATKTELAVLRAQRPQIPGVAAPSRGTQNQFTPEVVEAGVMASLGVSDEDRMKLYGERVLEAARPYERMGLQELFMLACQLDKIETPPIFGDGEQVIRAGFATNSLNSIVENVLGKQALLAYRAAEIQAMQFCRLSSTRDFKKVSRVRMLGSGRFERVSKAGELESGKLADQKYENQLDTFGQVLFIDRQTVINDDLQVLADAASEIGHTGAEVINYLAVEALLGAGSDFFDASLGNLLAGSTFSKFGETGLQNALLAFRKQKAGPGNKAKDKRPINIAPEIVLVPPEKEVEAQILFGSSDIRPGGTSGDRGSFNPWRGRYKLISMPHLSDTSFQGASATAWYLLANPNRLPALELLFLNNRREPKVERVSPPANTLGIGYRGYIDVGCNTVDPKGIVKCTGTGADPS